MNISPHALWTTTVSLLLTASMGWSQGVKTLKDINSSALAPSSVPDTMVSAGNRLYISTDDDVVGSELWLLDVVGTLNSPNSLALDSSSNVYVADTGNHTIRRITTAGIVSTLAGGTGVAGASNALGIAARFSSPKGVAVYRNTSFPATNGTVYVADTGNHVIRKITTDGSVTTFAGLAGTSGSVDGSSGAGSTSRFSSPEGIVVRGSDGFIFIADTGNHTIRQIASNGAVSTLAGTAGSSGATNAFGNAARFSSPRGVALDSAGNVYVADTGNHLIRKIVNGLVSTLAGDAGQSGSTNGTGTAARFSSPEGVAVDSVGNVYVVDTGNHLIRRITSAGVVTTLAGSAGLAGSTDDSGAAARFNSPRGLAVDSSGLFVADTSNHLIRKVTTAGVASRLAGTAGVAGGDEGGAASISTGAAPLVIKDILPGNGSSMPMNLTPVGSTLFFTALDSTNDRDLWKTNGTNSGTTRVGNNTEYSDVTGPEKLTNVNGTLFFVGKTLDTDQELWKSNGTTAGTVEVLDINSTPGLGGSLRDLFSYGNSLIFVADDQGARYGPDVVPPSDPAFLVGAELWKSDGTASGTVLMSDVSPGIGGSTGLAPPGFTLFNDFLYFSANGTNTDGTSGTDPVGRELFRTKGVTNAHVNVKDLQLGPTGSDPASLVVSGPTTGSSLTLGTLFFVASTTNEGRELYTSDGTLDDAGTVLVKDIKTGPGSPNIANITPIIINTTPAAAPTISNRVVFSADNGVDGNELWISDGTANETKMLKNITPEDTNTPDPDGSILANFVSLSSSLVVFTKEDATTGNLSLWRTDGIALNNAAGTVQIEDFLTETAPATAAVSAKQFRNPVLISSTLYFMMGDDELWKTNGVDDVGTVLVHRFRPGTSGSAAQNFAQLANGKAVFSATTSDEGAEPWMTDGTPGGTALLKNLFAGSTGSYPQNFTAGAGDLFFFTAEESADNREIFVSDGSTTSLLKEINPTGTSAPENLFWNNGTLYFSARNDDTNSELWISNGTPAGTVLLKDLNTDSFGDMTVPSSPGGFAAIDNVVYFAATENLTGRELYKTNGTAGGTVIVKDISASAGNDSNPEEMVVMPTTGVTRKLYFIASGSGGLNGVQETGRELWKSDGTDAGTVVVKDIRAGAADAIDGSKPAYLTLMNNMLFFVADDGVNGRELWKSDGTAVGTVMVKDIRSGNLGSDPTELRNVKGKLFFLADSGVSGRELWVSDGTTAGTVLVKDFMPGIADSGIDKLAVVNNVVCFVADDGISGREIWLSDGTAAGTRLAVDFVPGSSSSNPNNLFSFNNNLLFAASNAATGNEPRIAFMAPKIIVEQPAGAPLVSGAATVDFATVAFGQKVTRTFVIKDDGITSLGSITAILGGLNAAEFSIATKPASSIPGSGATTLSILFTPKEGGLRTATLTILSTDAGTPSFQILLSGNCTKDPTITLHPVSQMVNAGAPVTFTGSATGTAPLSLQWRRNAGVILGAVSSPYVIFSTLVTQAGTYSFQVKNGLTPVGTGTSNNAELGVVEDYSPARLQQVKAGTASTTITVNAGGNGLTYLWKKRSSGGALSGDARFKNINTKTLTINAPALADSVDYYCEVTGPGGTKIGGTTHLQVYNARPDVNTVQGMPDGVVSRMYLYQIKVAAGDAMAPVSYSALNLPLGVTVNTQTGLISGRPTKAGVYDKIKINATNGIGADLTPPGDQRVTIVDMPTGLDGVYAGLVGREANLNDNLGGRIDVAITALTGAFSGSLTMGTTKYSFKGGLDIGVDGMGQPAPPFSADVTIPRTGTLAPLRLTFTIEPPTTLDPTTRDRFSIGQVSSVGTSGAVTATVTGWKQKWKATPVGLSASAYLGLYNFGLSLPAADPNIGDDDVPQGNGYGSFTVAAAGTLTLAGKTADGESLTGGAFVGPLGEVLIFQTLYTTTRKGSICGTLTLDPNDNVITGNLDWVRPPNPVVLSASPASRTYRAGFGLSDTPVVTPVAVEAFGGRYVVPTTLLKIATPPAATPVPTTANASVKFTGGGVDGNVPSGPVPSLEPDITVAITSTNTVIVINPNAANSAKTKITPNRITGVIGGGFALMDTNPRTTIPLTPVQVPRAVTFQGLIVPEGGGATHRGVGYFMLPQMPTADNATLITTTRILSGKMVFTTP